MIRLWTCSLVLATSVWARAAGPELTPEILYPVDKECREVWRGKVANPVYRIGGEESYSAHYQRTGREQCWKSWLIVVYMAADNDLSPYAFRDLWEMEAIGSSVSVDVVVYLDSAEKNGSRYFHIHHSNAFDYPARFKQFSDSQATEPANQRQEQAFLTAAGLEMVHSPVLVTTDEEDSGDVVNAGKFLRWALSRYPARRVGLIGWSHGEGFDAGELTDDKVYGKQGGFAFDFTSKTHMVVTEMALRAKGLLKEMRNDLPFDIVGSDACLNQQVEFAYEWQGLARYVFGSSTIVQKKGFNYQSLLEWLVRNPHRSTYEFAREIPKLYGQSVAGEGEAAYSSYFDPYATMASWTIDELLPLKRSMEDLGTLLTEWLKEDPDEIERIDRAEKLKTAIYRSVRFGGVSHDLYSLLQNVKQWARDERRLAKASREHFWNKVEKAVDAASDCLNRAVVEKYLGPKYREGLVYSSKGVGVWFPQSSPEYRAMYPKLLKGRFFQVEKGPERSSWAVFIQELFEPNLKR